MTVQLPIRIAALMAGTVGAMWGQFSQPLSQKPSAGAPLNAPAAVLPTPAPANTATAAVPTQKATRRADVSYARGQLSVKADNASLNQILREIGHQTGIKITGGVAEERVFGSYGPASTAEVLNKLLDGTSSNVMLIAGESGAPGELVLTPRMGGATPPNPNAKGFDDDSDSDEDAPRATAPRGVTLFGGAQPAEAPPAATTTAPAAPPVTPAGTSNPNDANGAATPPQSPNGVKTPQEIYQQLQQLRQQQQQQQAQPPQQ